VQPAVVVVGADAPFGAAIVQRLAGDDHRVIALAYDALPGDCTGARAGSLEAVDLAAFMKREFPDVRPRAMVYVPRRTVARSIEATAVEDLVGVTDATLVGAEVAARYFLEHRDRNVPGQLVLMSGWAAMGLPFATAAAAASGGLIGLARSWALELAPSGIGVNAVVAGAGVEDSPWESAPRPIGRAPTEHEIAHAVAFFVDPRSHAINGQVLFVCGGLTPGIIPA